MTVIDLSSNFDAYPDFVNHYRTFWAGNAPLCSNLPEQEIIRRRTMVAEQLQLAEEKFQKIGISTNNISAMVFVGAGAANGHAFFDGEQYVAWFDLASFPSELTTKVFVMHELIHALHYSMSPGFYFRTVEEKNSLWRQLITEGIATYLTQQLWGLSDKEALWGDFLAPQQLDGWMDECKKKEWELRNVAIQNYDSSDPPTLLFQTASPIEVFSYRGGYFIGLKVVQEFVKKELCSIRELLRMTVPALYKRTREILLIRE